MRTTTNRHSRGFTLIEVMISLGLVSILALAVFTLNTFMNEGKMRANNAFQGDQFRKQIVALLTNPTAWRNTLIKNSSVGTPSVGTTFDCILKGTDCALAAYNGPPSSTDFSVAVMSNDSTATVACAAGSTSCHGGFDVYDTNNNSFYPFASDAKRGFQFSGAQCGTDFANGQTVIGAPGWTGKVSASGKSSVGSAKTSSLCPFRLVLWWVPVCPSTLGTCYSPAVNVKGYLLYTPNPKDPMGNGAINPANYGIDLILQPNITYGKCATSADCPTGHSCTSGFCN